MLYVLVYISWWFFAMMIMVFLLSQSDSTMTIWDSTLLSSYIVEALLASVSLYTLYYWDSDAFFPLLPVLLFNYYYYYFLIYIYMHLHGDEKWFLTFAVSTVAVRLRTHRLVLPVTARIETFLGCLSVYVYMCSLYFVFFFSLLYLVLV